MIRSGGMVPATAVARGRCGDGRGRNSRHREPTAVLADFAHERSDLLEIALVFGATIAAAAAATRTTRLTAPVIGDRGRRQTIVHDGRTVGLVFLQVSVQVSLLSEAPFAQRTLERLLFIMYVPHVSLQIG